MWAGTVSAEPVGIASATSEAGGHEARNGYDGSLATSWKAETGSGPVSLLYLFPESRPLQSIRTAFPVGRAYLYRIDVTQEDPREKGEATSWLPAVPEKIGEGVVTDSFGPIQVKAVKTTLRNLLKNSGFEEGKELSVWHLADGKIITELTKVHTGRRAVGAESGYVVMVYPLELEFEERKTFTFSFYGMSPDKGTGYLVLFAEKQDGTPVTLEKSLGMFRPEYTFHRASFFLDPEIVYLKRANFYRFAPQGSVYYDDIFLTEGWTPTDIPEIREQHFE